jgi:hypothetical protein
MPFRTDWDNAGNTLKKLPNNFNLALHFLSPQPDGHPRKTTLGQTLVHITSTVPCSTFVLAVSLQF